MTKFDHVLCQSERVLVRVLNVQNPVIPPVLLVHLLHPHVVVHDCAPHEQKQRAFLVQLQHLLVEVPAHFRHRRLVLHN